VRLRDSATILEALRYRRWITMAGRGTMGRAGGRAGVITPQSHTMTDGVGIMTGAMRLDS